MEVLNYQIQINSIKVELENFTKVTVNKKKFDEWLKDNILTSVTDLSLNGEHVQKTHTNTLEGYYLYSDSIKEDLGCYIRSL
jgi:uncharacterized protein (DUF608 family)